MWNRKPSILFCSHTRTANPCDDPSSRHRSVNLAQELARRRFHCHFCSQNTFEANSSLWRRYDRFVFHRPCLTPGLADFLAEYSGSHKIIADFDEICFDVRLAEHVPTAGTGKGFLTQTQILFASTADALSNFRLCTVATSPLREHLARHLGIPDDAVHVLPTGMDPGFLGICHEARRRQAGRRRPFRFGFFRGTPAGEKDVEIAAPALAGALATDVGAEMLVVGTIDLPAALHPYADRITQRPLLPYTQVPLAMAEVETIVFPLEDTPLNRARSAVTLAEAAIAGCDIVATSIPDMARFASPFLRACTTAGEWNDALATPRSASEAQRDEEARRIAQSVAISRQADRWIDLFIE